MTFVVKKIKLAFLEDNAQIGGAEVNVLNLVKRLNPEGFSPLVICPFEGPFVSRIRAAGGRADIVPRLPLFSTSTFIRGRKITNPLALLYDLFSFIPSSLLLARFLRHEQVDVVHTNSMLAHLYGGVAARIAGVRCLWHMQDIVDGNQALGILQRSLNLFGRYLPQRIIVVSEAVKRTFHGNTRDKVKVVYNGTDISVYGSGRSGGRVRKEIGIGPGEIVVGMVGRVVHWKGHREFLQAAHLIHEELPGVKFVIVGDSSLGGKEYFDEIKRFSRSLGLQDCVIFTGFRDDVPDVFAAMDVVVHASTLPEPCALSLMEAMASSKPVVATRGGGTPEIVDDGITGKLVPMRNVKALAEAVSSLVSNPQERERMGCAGRKRVEELFSLDIFVRNMGDVYSGLFAGKTK